ncbi:hypothetical protein WICANDRAFT_106545 [Wickerhamomyces anomalus NRRL Y-366-8]|uniref:Uncharacterized protein n=1 Tax=Wickerhamomyces anomalus (strain ATCC 58044 / CBS 1984 / NCYC 433 / NRRL Y-366-8) TaxID=683960 RepID=A0A1E3NY74_WICAA|nr:uncharacterized protein WICANDRAFT_106545 [Wickerhamomyces anomalus NRRL Y-366-8]ODQ58159.1 hypothetical protein WICANDRAFT_106545 [Wickerhamomyces anomalus NRRL Y-366-8]
MTTDVFKLKSLPIEVLLDLQLFGVSPFTMMLVDKYFLNLFAREIYTRVHCIMNVDFTAFDQTKYRGPDYLTEEQKYEQEVGSSVEMLPVSRSICVKGVTLLTSEKNILDFFNGVLMKGFMMKKYIRKITFDSLVIENSDFLDLRSDFFIRNRDNIIISPFFSQVRYSVTALALQYYAPNHKIQECDLNRLKTRTESSEIEPTTSEVTFHSGALDCDSRSRSSRQFGVTMQICNNFSDGSRHSCDPFENPDKAFDGVSIHEDEFVQQKDGTYNLENGFVERNEAIAGNIDLVDPCLKSRSSLYKILTTAIVGMQSVGPNCEAEFCGYVSKTADSAYYNDTYVITYNKMKLLGFKIGPQDREYLDAQNARPLVEWED